jgi:hypothetical protein
MGQFTYRGRRVHHPSELARLEAHWDGVDDFTIDRARQGLNRSCVDCFQKPLHGGLRCLPCYQEVATPLVRTESVTSFRHGTEHGAARHRKRGEAPCSACQEAERRASRERKRRSRSAA